LHNKFKTLNTITFIFIPKDMYKYWDCQQIDAWLAQENTHWVCTDQKNRVLGLSVTCNTKI